MRPNAGRIWNKQEIERDGHVLGDGDAVTALPDDFSLPSDDVHENDDHHVALLALRLSPISSLEGEVSDVDRFTSGSAAEPGNAAAINTFIASLMFHVKSAVGGRREMMFPLRYDIQFVTAHPCVPSQHARNILSTAGSPTPWLKIPRKPIDSRRSGPHELFTGMFP
jgi:hypothetical protein